jgi:predicted transcriptional regulator
MTKVGENMRITIRIEDDVMRKLLYLTGARKKSTAISLAISDFLKRQGKEKLLKLKGNLDLIDNWKELREAELYEK